MYDFLQYVNDNHGQFKWKTSEDFIDKRRKVQFVKHNKITKQ